jgi:hypothetical protein
MAKDQAFAGRGRAYSVEVYLKQSSRQTYDSVGKLVKMVDGSEKISLNEGNSRQSFDLGGAGPNITNFPTEPYRLDMKVTGERYVIQTFILWMNMDM